MFFAMVSYVCLCTVFYVNDKVLCLVLYQSVWYTVIIIAFLALKYSYAFYEKYLPEKWIITQTRDAGLSINSMVITFVLKAFGCVIQ